MDRLRLDLRYAFRQIRQRPVFAVVAALSLAIGVGANTAIFGAVSAILLRPIHGVSEPERVVELGRSTQGRGFDTFSWPDYLDVREHVSAFESTAAFTLELLAFSRNEEGERITGMHVEPAYFQVMGVHPDRGRFFAAEDADPSRVASTIVLGHDFWRNRLGGDPDVVGSTVRVNRVPFTVIGVAPEDFRGHTVAFQPDVYVPIRSSPLVEESASIWTSRNTLWHQAVARLAPGATIEEANTQLQGLFARLAEEYPETSAANRSASAVPLGLIPGAGRAAVAGFLGVLMGMVLLILLVTCANVAGMFLARGTAREREIAVRLALGSGRARLVAQLLTEALVVFAVGGLLGGVVGAWTLGLIPFERLPVPIPVYVDLSPDVRVLGFGLLVTLVTGVVFGLLPALQATRLDLTASLKEDGRRGGRTGGLRRFFVAGQVALSLVLLASAGLLLRSLQRAASLDTGFDASDTYMTGIDLALEGYGPAEGAPFWRRLQEGLRELPGVEATALAIDLPLDLSRHGSAAYPEGWLGPDGEDDLEIDFNYVSPGYFRTLRIPVLEGRDFDDRDEMGAPPVVIVSRALVAAVWPGQSAVGRRLRVGLPGEARTVVAVVEDAKNQVVTEAPKPFLYVPLWQDYRQSATVLVRTQGDLASVGATLRQTILRLDPSLSLTPVVEVERYTSIGVLPQRIAAGVTTLLGAFAVVLAGLGVYGVVAFAVTRRTREIGVRMALGAGRRSVIRHVVMGGLGLALPGIVLGGIAALGTGRLLRFLLLGVSPTDPLALGVVGALLTGVIVLASAVPARRASAIEPVEALRSE